MVSCTIWKPTPENRRTFIQNSPVSLRHSRASWRLGPDKHRITSVWSLRGLPRLSGDARAIAHAERYRLNNLPPAPPISHSLQMVGDRHLARKAEVRLWVFRNDAGFVISPNMFARGATFALQLPRYR